MGGRHRNFVKITRIDENPHSSWYRGGYFEEWASTEGVRVSTRKNPEMVWVDIETTGLNELEDVPLELGIVLTDKVGRIIPEGVASWVIYDSRDHSWDRAIARAKLHQAVGPMHEKSGLFDQIQYERRIADATKTEYLMLPHAVASSAIGWLKLKCAGVRTWPGDKDQAALSGSSPHFDRKFLDTHLRDLGNWFHYRNGADVSATRNLQRMLAPESIVEVKRRELHRPIPDLLDSIAVYRLQLSTFLKIGEDARSLM